MLISSRSVEKMGNKRKGDSAATKEETGQIRGEFGYGCKSRGISAAF